MSEETKSNKLSLSERLKNATTKQWIKGILAVVIYILFIIWVGNFWWLLLTPVFFDIFITKYIPWGFWKNVKNKTLRSILGWVDAILFALIAVYFIFNFLFQNYQIPTSSLEKTLLVGDFLCVSKASYGPRIPMTPLSFPLAQHTMPITGTKSYFEKPQWEYRRLRGITNIKLDDIVVFNFPTGDTVALKVQNPDYYTLVYSEGLNKYKSNTQKYHDIETGSIEFIQLVNKLGREEVRKNQYRYGEIVYRPVDRRENYVKRCVAMPGDTFEMSNNQIYVNGEPQPHFPGIQHNYFIQTDGSRLSNDLLTNMGISKEDRVFISNTNAQGLLTLLNFDQELPVYYFPLTQENYEKMRNMKEVKQIKVEPSLLGGDVWPFGANYGWDRDNYGPLYIPKRGDNIELNLDNILIYERIIGTYEKNKLEVKDSVIYINNQPATTYTVKMDYYWMMGDNRHKSADSRYWGFVPEDHVVGRPLFVWLSLDKDKSGFGKIRWNRFFTNAKR